MANAIKLNTSSASTVIQISKDGMGSAEEVLKHTLLRVHLTMLLESEFYPGAECFHAGESRWPSKVRPSSTFSMLSRPKACA